MRHSCFSLVIIILLVVSFFEQSNYVINELRIINKNLASISEKLK